MKKHLILLLISIGFLSSCNQMKRFEMMGQAQGTYYKIIYYDKVEVIAEEVIDSLLIAVDQSVSLWVNSSIIRRVNENDSNTIVDKIFIENFNLGKKIAKETNGAFDFTVEPIVSAWGFGHNDERLKIDNNLIDSIMMFVGYNKVWLDSNIIVKADPRLRIDFNAIAQGYTVDIIASYIKSKGIKTLLVDVGGEVITVGMKPDKSPWIVGIDKPSDNAEIRELQTKIKLYDAAMATSGNYRKYYIKDGIKFSHTIDPASGKPVYHSLLSATVIGASCAESDAYATAFMVMGLEKSKQFLADHPELKAYLIYDEKGYTKTFYTQSFGALLMD